MCVHQNYYIASTHRLVSTLISSLTCLNIFFISSETTAYKRSLDGMKKVHIRFWRKERKNKRIKFRWQMFLPLIRLLLINSFSSCVSQKVDCRFIGQYLRFRSQKYRGYSLSFSSNFRSKCATECNRIRLHKPDLERKRKTQYFHKAKHEKFIRWLLSKKINFQLFTFIEYICMCSV